jgi:leader peptidase (prepilin peptidase)/N-methyltransferase
VFYFLSFLFGASIGSFVQVVATRLNVAPILKGRSKCLSCGEALRVSDLVPVLSYIFLKGKCRYCKSAYGPSALVIEVLYGVTFMAVYHFMMRTETTYLAAVSLLVYYTVLFGVFGVMALYDKAHTYIPISFLLTYLGLTFSMLLVRFFGDQSVLVLLSPVIVALPFLFVWLVTKGKGVGFGDVLLFLGVGAFFSISQGYAVLLISIWTGALFGLYIKYFGSGKGKKNTALPFVPFILLAFVIVLFTDIDMSSIAGLFQ